MSVDFPRPWLSLTAMSFGCFLWYANTTISKQTHDYSGKTCYLSFAKYIQQSPSPGGGVGRENQDCRHFIYSQRSKYQLPGKREAWHVKRKSDKPQSHTQTSRTCSCCSQFNERGSKSVQIFFADYFFHLRVSMTSNFTSATNSKHSLTVPSSEGAGSGGSFATSYTTSLVKMKIATGVPCSVICSQLRCLNVLFMSSCCQGWRTQN